MQKQKDRHKQSFTLIELLVVIAIIAILAVVIIANVTSAQSQARDDRRTQDLNSLRTTLELYYADHNEYPYGAIGSYSDDGFCIEEAQGFKDLLINGGYISSIPQDPLYNSSQCSSYNADCHCYIYRTQTLNKYKLFAKVEQQNFELAKQDGGIYDTNYEVYSSNVGSNQIARPWTSCGEDITFTYNGSTVTYGTVVGANNRCWLDRNLGASRVATSPTDSEAYGDLFQWGRCADGHQVRNNPPIYEVTGPVSTPSCDTSNEWYGKFVKNSTSPYDWIYPQNDNLWQGATQGTNNNPCPTGWRIPTEDEWDTERKSWGQQNVAEVFASPLKLTAGGRRSHFSGSLRSVGSNGYYWSSTVSSPDARNLYFRSSGAYMSSFNRANGFSVRCVKD